MPRVWPSFQRMILWIAHNEPLPDMLVYSATAHEEVAARPVVQLVAFAWGRKPEDVARRVLQLRSVFPKQPGIEVSEAARSKMIEQATHTPVTSTRQRKRKVSKDA